MSLILGETKIPALVAAYLETRRDHADYPLPSLSALPITAGPVKGSTRSFPSVEVWAAQFNLPNLRDFEEYDVAIALYADPDQAQATEDLSVAHLRAAFTGMEFIAYLNGLADKTGWQVLAFWLTGGSIIVDAEDRSVTRMTTARCTFRSQTLTA